MTEQPNRWLASRWLVLSVAFGAAAFYLALTVPEHGGVNAFTVIGGIALGGGHLTNGLRDSRGEPRRPPPPDGAVG